WKCRDRYLKQEGLDRLELLTLLGQIVKENKGEHLICDMEDVTPACDQSLKQEETVKPFQMSYELRIMLFGKSEKDKTTLGNLIIRGNVFKSSWYFTTKKTESAHGHLKGKPLTVIKVPDFSSLTVETLEDVVRECANLCSPGPNVLLLLVKPSEFTEKNRQTLEFILNIYGPDAFKYSMLILTQKEQEDTSSVKRLLQDCRHRQHRINFKKSEALQEHYKKLVEKIENVVSENRGGYLTVTEEAGLMKVPEHSKPALNLVFCGRSGAGKTTVINAILGRTVVGPPASYSECVKHQAEVCGRRVSLVELPALYGKTQEAVMEESFRCVSLCDPEGV
ncbi:hypothetical protein LDENG_00285570, partial [Lucifuga dentata]